MSLEQELKKLILSRYKSIRVFVNEANIPYTTMDTIFKRGIIHSSIQNVMAICSTLGISVDELAMGRITPITRDDNTKTVENALFYARNTMDTWTLNGIPLSTSERESLIDVMETAVDLIKKKRDQK